MNDSGSIRPDPAAIALFPIDTRPVLAEQEGNAPKTCQTDQAINDSAQHSALPSKDPCNQVKLEQAYKTPVQRADNR